ncbi:hypothetical protein Tco_1304706 [Tanacetum coccineum]
MKLDGMSKEEEEAIIKVKGEALIEKEDPRAFVIPIRLEGKINLNALADTGSDIIVMPYRVYEELGKEEVSVTTNIAKCLILDMPIDRDTTILVGRGFLHTCGGIVNKIDNITSTFDGICHQTFHATKISLDTVESDSDDEEEYAIQRNKFGAPIYRPKPARYLNCNDPLDRSLALQEVLNLFRKICVRKKVVSLLGSLPTMGTHDDEAGSSRPKCSRQYKTVEEVLLPQVHQEFLEWECCNRDVKSRMGCGKEINGMLRINLCEAGTNEEIFPSVALIGAFNINETIYSELCHEFYSTYEFDEVCADDKLKTKKIIKFKLGGRAHSLTLLEFARRLGLYHAEELDEEGIDMKRKGAGTQRESMICCKQFIIKIARKVRVLSDEVLRSLSALIYYRDLDTATLRELIDCDGKLIPEAPQPGVPRVAIPRP